MTGLMGAQPAEPLTLSMAIATHGHTAALKQGVVTASGLRFDPIEVTPIVAAFRRMVRGTEFDVCEMSPTTYLTARAFGKPFTAIPVFISAMFHHRALVHNEHSGIQTAADFAGRRVGVRAYTVATGVWVRGVLHDEYGLNLDDVTWVTDDEEHVTEFEAPANVVKAPTGASLAELLLDGQIDAAFTGAAGVGRAGAPTAGWETGGAGVLRVEDAPHIRSLEPDIGAVEESRFHRTGVLPIHGVVVVKDSVLQAHPWVAAELFRAFSEAKRRYLRRLAQTGPTSTQDEIITRRQSVVGEDPCPYGIEPNRASLEAMLRYAHEQQLTPRRYTIEEIFDRNSLDLG